MVQHFYSARMISLTSILIILNFDEFCNFDSVADQDEGLGFFFFPTSIGPFNFEGFTDCMVTSTGSAVPGLTCNNGEISVPCFQRPQFGLQSTCPDGLGNFPIIITENVECTLVT